MQTSVKAAVTKPDTTRAQPRILRKRIGSTTLEVSIRFSETSTETMRDKTLRLMEREVKNA
jgi:hypothetical protein